MLHKDKVPVESFPITHVHLAGKNSYADITFVFSNGQKIPAHSCIIQARCPGLTQNAAAPIKKAATLRRPQPREQQGSIQNTKEQ